LNTVKERILLNQGVNFHCNNCGVNVDDLDLQAIMKSKGPSFRFENMTCKNCGSTDTGISVFEKSAGKGEGD
jgi:predicted RNA-binding Zn-ribbon protein involved in translation (DUF1610 family)